MRKAFIIVGILLALVGVDAVARSVYAEVSAFRAQRAQVDAMVLWLLAPVGTRTVDGKQVPLNRADGLADMLQQRLADAEKGQ